MKKHYFFIDASGDERGPITVDFFKKYGLKGDRLIWFDGLPTWVEARTTPALKEYLGGDDKLDSVTAVIKKHHGELHRGANPEWTDRHAPKSWLFESVVVTLLCCLPAGLAGVYYANKSTHLWAAGEYARSLRCSKIAKNWAFGGVLFILSLWIAYFLYVVVFHIAKGSVNLFNMENYLL